MSMPMYQQQPGATVGMVIAPGGGGNRNVKGLPVYANGRKWSHDFCGCFSDCRTCFFATCCPCILFGKNKHRYQHLNATGIPDPNPSFCTGSCVGHGILTTCGMGWILQMMTRGDIRHRYNVKGGGFSDCCASFWCSPCSLVQESREIDLEEGSFRPMY